MSRNNNNNQDEELNAEALITNLELWSKITELMDSNSVLRIIFLLLMYKKLSLRELSDILGRTKATISHHLSKIKDINLLTITTEDARGSIDAHIYSLRPEFYDMLNYDFTKLKRFKAEELKKIFRYNILKDKGNFKVFKSLLDRANQFYEDFEQFKSEKEEVSFDEIKKFYFNNLINYKIWFLSEEGREKLEKINEEYQKQIENILKEDKEKKGKKEKSDKSFLLLNFVIPLKNLIEYDQKDKQFLQFFEYFD
ncbi:MAG: hypothetical protein BAJALOKI1v1_860005 [Promethearchaeota archaeon]|nr:MAG: hypothetical protein BAJALOKI1v1_860005 [Candidatus Lokiarchaeota archaeon]